jgi:tetraacyldisaccharide 4'-kinase
MASEAPPFWWQPPDWRAYALYPVSAVYAAVASRRMNAARRERIDVPVLCIGNFTVGGAGKTPAAIALANEARRMQLSPGFLSRGFGGKFPVPHVVDAHHDSARHVGDEPLLLAEHAPVAVTPDRAAGAKLLASRGCDFLIMDDGFQSARIHMDYALLVVDGRRGVGNGHVIPGGPVRAPLVHQMRFAHAVLKIGAGEAANDIVRMASRAGRPVYEAHTAIRDPQRFAGRRFLAFAGIGDPDKFFDTVAEAGGEVAMTRGFPDHHFFTKDDLADLSAAAAEKGLELITTAKDAVRLRHGASHERAFAAGIDVLEIELVFDLSLTPRTIIDATLTEWRNRHHAAGSAKRAADRSDA